VPWTFTAGGPAASAWAGALLQVETDNVTAARLYEGLGFHAVQRYAYRQHRQHRQHRPR